MLTIRRGKSLLGICFIPHAVRICEVELSNRSTGGPMPIAARTAEFPWPREESWHDDASAAQAMGKSLAKFLSDHGFSARQAVLGVPARWLIAQPHQIPPADAESAAAMLRLHASERTMPDLGDMVFDYGGESSTAHPATVLLAGIQRRWIEQLRLVAQAARLQLLTILPTSCAVAAAVHSSIKQSKRASLVLLLQADEAEIIGQENGQPRLLRHIRFGTTASTAAAQPVGFLETSHVTPAAACIAALRQAAASIAITPQAPKGGVASTELPSAAEIILCNDGGDKGLIDEIRQALGQEARSFTLDIPLSNGNRATSEISATAVALSAAGDSPGQINFLHPRLLQPAEKKREWRKPTIIAAAVLILAILAAAIDLTHLHSQTAAAESELVRLQSSLQQARPFVASMQFVESFQADRPRYIACLCDLTSAMPADSPARLTTFSLAADMRGQIAGRAARQQDVIDYVDRLGAEGHFAEVHCRFDDAPGSISGPSRSANDGLPPQEVSFSLTFTYMPVVASDARRLPANVAGNVPSSPPADTGAHANSPHT